MSSAVAAPAQRSVARELMRLSELLGAPAMCYDLRSGKPVAATDDELLAVVPPELMWECVQSGASRVHSSVSGLNCFAIPFPAGESGAHVAVGYVLAKPALRPADLVFAAAEKGWSQARLDRWLARLPYCEADMLRRHVALAADDLCRAAAESVEQADNSHIARQLESTYEEINLLHTLTQHMHVAHSPRDIAELSLARISGVIAAEGHAVWLDDHRDGRLFLIHGTIPFDEIGMARLIARFDGHDWPRPLVRNHVAGTLLGDDFPGLKNMALMPIGDSRRYGWICSCNCGDGQDFGSVQTSLLSSVASILATHQRNLDLFREHEDLLLSFVRSLVSSLDAKDAYTRGHSERVALISRRLGMQLGLAKDDLRNIYLSGLLHDIGKIGVDDQILRKVGPLTHEEFDQIKKHPVIGYNILAGLKNLHAVLPGVRNHHEAYSGRGYPDGLKGEAIPLMARIIAVADSFDAMTSDRPYRKGLALERLEEILREGAGIQWDPKVVEAFFVVRDEIRNICASYSPDAGSLLGESSPSARALVEAGSPLASIDNISAALKLAETI
ncbi:MAG TPA: HD-GYP domain-containing protein [Planctomycetaceae bacterium]|nr:HD-GYP domain-containing protein [Planctomycetaceae bacterium]